MTVFGQFSNAQQRIIHLFLLMVLCSLGVFFAFYPFENAPLSPLSPVHHPLSSLSNASHLSSQASSDVVSLASRLDALEALQKENNAILNTLQGAKHAAQRADALFDLQTEVRTLALLARELRGLKSALVSGDVGEREDLPNVFFLSIVVCGRNDDAHESSFGDTQSATQHFLDSLGAEALAADLWIELVFVEWNPPPNRRSVLEQFRWPTRLVRTKIVHVPKSVHDRVSKKLGKVADMHKWVGLNVGVRRAEGEYVLVTNSDCLIAAGFLSWVKRKVLTENVLYTGNTPHHTVGKQVIDLPRTVPLSEIRRVCAVDPRAIRVTEPDFSPVSPNTVHPEDLLLAKRDVWRRLRGFVPTEQRPAVALQRTATHFGVGSSFIAHHVICHQHHKGEVSDPIDAGSEPPGKFRLGEGDWGLPDEDEIEMTLL